MSWNTIRQSAAAAAVATAGGVLCVVGTGDASAATPECNSYQNVVASVETHSAAATICQWRGDGRLEYHGVTKASGDAITVPVSLVVEQGSHPGLYSYTAVNAGYTYRVDDKMALAVIDPEGTLVFFERQI